MGHLAERLGESIEAAFGLRADRPAGFLHGRCELAAPGFRSWGGTGAPAAFSVGPAPSRARPWPRSGPSLAAGWNADSNWGQPLLAQASNADLRALEAVRLPQLLYPYRQIVVPGWRGVLPVGPRTAPAADNPPGQILSRSAGLAAVTPGLLSAIHRADWFSDRASRQAGVADQASGRARAAAGNASNTSWELRLPPRLSTVVAEAATGGDDFGLVLQAHLPQGTEMHRR